MQGPPPPPLHHHHSMHNPVTTQVSQSSSQALIPPGRPHFERAHTFPTPPTSANSMVGVPNQGNSYEWTNNVHNSHSLSIDTGLGNSRSMPTTPATTPPGSNMQSMQSYQNQSGYDSKPYYSSGSASQAQYASQQQPAPQNMPRYEGGSEKPREGDSNLGGANRYYHSQGNGQVTQASTGGENAPEHETDYVNDSNNAYNSNRSSYNYSNNHSSGNIHSDQNHLSSDIATTQASTNGSDRLNSRSTGGQSQWTSGYSTPRLAPPPSTHYNVVSDTRSTSANGNNGDSYSASSNAAPVYTSSSMNGGSNKRSRDDSDHEEPAPRPASQNCESGAYEHKRRKTLTENPVGGPVGGAPLTVQSLKNGSAPRRR